MLCVVESISWNSILPTTLRFCWCHGLFLFFVASINTFMASSQGSVTHGLVTSDGMDLWCPIFILLSSDEICFHFLWVLCVIHLDALLLSLHCYVPVHQCTLRGHVNFSLSLSLSIYLSVGWVCPSPSLQVLHVIRLVRLPIYSWCSVFCHGHISASQMIAMSPSISVKQ